jgi:hypothetical protein
MIKDFPLAEDFGLAEDFPLAEVDRFGSEGGASRDEARVERGRVGGGGADACVSGSVRGRFPGAMI